MDRGNIGVLPRPTRLADESYLEFVTSFRNLAIRELFPRGLTLLDLKDIGVKQLNISNVAARQELRDLLKSINLPGVDVTF